MTRKLELSLYNKKAVVHILDFKGTITLRISRERTAQRHEYTETMQVELTPEEARKIASLLVEQIEK